jgi:hypothetical protein
MMSFYLSVFGIKHENIVYCFAKVSNNCGFKKLFICVARIFSGLSRLINKINESSTFRSLFVYYDYKLRSAIIFGRNIITPVTKLPAAPNNTAAAEASLIIFIAG